MPVTMNDTIYLGLNFLCGLPDELQSDSVKDAKTLPCTTKERYFVVRRIPLLPIQVICAKSPDILQVTSHLHSRGLSKLNAPLPGSLPE